MRSQTRGFACSRAGFRGFDGGGFIVVGWELVRGKCSGFGSYAVLLAAPTPALPHGGRALFQSHRRELFMLF